MSHSYDPSPLIDPDSYNGSPTAPPQDSFLASLLLESLHLAPLSLLSHRHPSKFQSTMPFLDTEIVLSQHPGAVHGGSNGGTVWNCARALVGYVENRALAMVGMQGHYEAWKGKRVVEVGAGTGAVGIACGMAGAEVTLTDKEGMMELIQTNVKLNNLLNASGIEALRFGAWRSKLYEKQWDYVVASDVVYDAASFGKILYTFYRLLLGNKEVRLSVDCIQALCDEEMSKEDSCKTGNSNFENIFNVSTEIIPAFSKSLILLSFKLRDDYPCFPFFRAANKIFFCKLIDRDLYDRNFDYHTVYLIQMHLLDE